MEGSKTYLLTSKEPFYAVMYYHSLVPERLSGSISINIDAENSSLGPLTMGFSTGV